jgi:formylglycine-generating enzyme required for sulfatase activity
MSLRQRLIRIFAGAMLAAAACSPACANTRVALVIGNGAYQNAAKLANPANDAGDVAQLLRRVGFDVIDGRDLDQRAMVEKIREFGRKLERADVALFFYAGHGLQVAGKNYLVPIDAKLERPGDLNFETIDLAQVQAQMAAENRVNLIFLDACRDNPLARTLARSMGGGTRAIAVSQGLASVQSTVGTMIAYATQPDDVALDGQGRNSPFTTALLKHAATPGLEISTVMKRVRVDVIATTRGKQVPWDHSSLTGDVVLVAPAAGPPPAAAVAGPGEAERVWAEVAKTTNPAVLEAFIARYGDSFHANLARARLDELKAQTVAALPPRPAMPGGKETEPRIVGTLPSARPLRVKDVFKSCDACPEMVVVPPGSFTMGSPANEPSRSTAEGPQRVVTLAKPFAVSRFAVTFAEWDACVADRGCNGYRPADEGWDRGRRPVINVSWHDAKAYVTWLSRKTGRPYRLLSEAEREYVARAGTSTPFWFGATVSPQQANYDASRAYNGGPTGDNRERTVLVDSFAANPWGLYQVHGNVWEWVEDCWHADYTNAPSDGAAVGGECTRRVLRGGSWVDAPGFLRSAFRKGDQAAARDQSIGFRVATPLN